MIHPKQLADMELVKNIFELVEAGIVHGYDSFRYEVEVGHGCMEAALTVEKQGVTSTDAETDFDSFVIYELVKKLKENAENRGEPWISFDMDYQRGGDVKTKFTYPPED